MDAATRTAAIDYFKRIEAAVADGELLAAIARELRADDSVDAMTREMLLGTIRRYQDNLEHWV